MPLKFTLTSTAGLDVLKYRCVKCNEYVLFMFIKVNTIQMKTGKEKAFIIRHIFEEWLHNSFSKL